MGHEAKRQAIDAELRHRKKAPTSAEEWRFLLWQEYFKVHEWGEEDEDNLFVERGAECVLALRRLRAQERVPAAIPNGEAGRSEGGEAQGLRGSFRATAHVCGAVAALEAEDLPEVRTFRKRYLGNRLLNVEDIPAFLAQHQDGRENATHTIVFCGKLYAGSRGLIPELHRLEKFLSDRYGWSERDVVAFVLAGEAPSSVIMSFGLQFKVPYAFISLSLPAFSSPNEAAALYRSAMTHFRFRPLRFGKHVAQLVEFFCERLRAGCTMSQAAREWQEKTGENAEAARVQVNRVFRKLAVKTIEQRD